MAMTILGWSFKSDHKLREMLKRINAAWPEPWVEGDSDRHEYLAGALTSEGVGRIYAAGDHYVANLRFYSEKPDHRLDLLEAQQTLVTKLLPLVGARDVQPCAPFE